MYAVAARIQGAAVREVPLLRERGFALDTDGRARGLRRQHEDRLPVLALTTRPATPMEPAAIEQLLVALVGQRAGGGRRGLHRVLRRRDR